MSTTIACPHCGKSIAIEEVLKHQVEDQLLAENEKKHQLELEELRQKTLKEAQGKVKSEYELQLKSSDEEKKEMKERNEKLQEQVLELTKQMRKLIAAGEDQKLENEKRMTLELEEERKRIRQKVEDEKALEQHQKEMEKEKIISDLRKALDDARRKADQGSQQTQGEVVELQLEELLRSTFPSDTIEPIGKGVNGADIRQIVCSNRGTRCGVILWESKQTKRWEEKWVAKLKGDMRQEKADLAAIVSAAPPTTSWNGMDVVDGVWVSSFGLTIPLAMLLRKALLDAGYQKAVVQHQGTKAELLYGYVTGHEFRQQIEALVEVSTEMQSQIARERAAYEKIWKQREGQLHRLYTSTATIFGSIQGLAGSSAVPELKGLDVLQLEES